MTNVLSGILPRPLIEWTEPSVFQRARSDAERPGFHRLYVVSVVVCLAFIAYVAYVSPPLALRLVVVLGIILVMLRFIQWSYRTFPSRVRLTTDAIVCDIQNKNAWRWQYTKIDHCEIANGVIGGVPAGPALVIHSTHGARVVLGIAPEVDTAALRAILVEHGVTVDGGVLESAV